ncbi:MAG: protein tyrosine phosphatase [Candidatus Moraniibacteriota bacterium]
MKEKLLFVCSANMMRSPTAEDLFKDSLQYEAKSAGILPMSVTHITQSHLNWADRVFLMSEKEDGHLTYLRNHFDIEGKNIEVLEIPNIYQRGDPKLVELLQKRLGKFLEF